MPRKSEPIETGIRRDRIGYRVITKVHGIQKERRYAPESDVDNLRLERANWIVERKRGEEVAPAKSFDRAYREYLKTIPPGSRRHEDAVNNLTPWLPRFRTHDVGKITSAVIREQISLWQSDDYAASTLNHRRQELKNLFTFLNGTAGANPVRDVPKIRERYDDARGQTPRLIAAILAELPENQSKRYLAVWWETAMPPSQQARLTRSTFHPDRKCIFAQPRRKGAGVPGRMLPLTAAGVRALTAFFDAGLEGKRVSTSTIHRDFTAAVEKVRGQWIGRWPAPANLSPKDLRHSRLTEAYKRSKDLNAVAELGMHANISTTQRYVRAVASDTAKAAVRAMERASRNVPAGHVKNRQNRPKRTATKSARNRPK